MAAPIIMVHGAFCGGWAFERFTAPFEAAGHVVHAPDLRGHGPNDRAEAVTGVSMLDYAADIAALAKSLPEPPILLGHSMGAAFAQVYFTKHHQLLDALILSGTAAAWLPRGERRDMNSLYPNPRTDYDWLSRDAAEVDKYIADPLCKIRFTPESGRSFRTIGEQATDPGYLQQVKKDLPVYIFVGDEDPVNDRLARVTPLLERYRDAGLTDVELKVYPGGRHEMLNETNRDEVVADLLAWLEARFGRNA